MEQVALSKSNAFGFLNGINQAGELQSPLETAQKPGFATNITGAIKLAITPAMLMELEELRKINVTTDFKKLALFVSVLQAKMPVQDKLAVVLINPLLLASHVPFCQTPEDVTDAMLEQSQWKIEINAENDYALIDGVPVWDRLDGERVDFYNVFKLYRDSRYGLLESGEFLLGTRTMAGLARQLNVSPALVSMLAKVYNWACRCTYYDRYMETEIVKHKQSQITALQSRHFSLANKLMDEACNYLQSHAALLTPKDALEMAALAFKYSRISVGLSGDKPNGAVGPTGDSPAIAFYNTTTNNNADKMVQVNNNNAKQQSDVERQLQEDMKDTNMVSSILHILQNSGAMATALNSTLNQNKDDKVDSLYEDGAVDVVEINDDNASEGGQK